MRVIGLSILSCVLIAIMVLTTRFWGLGQVYKPFESRFYTEQVENILQVTQIEQIEKDLDPQLILSFKILKNPTTQKLEILNLPFEEFFKKSFSQRMILNLDINTQDIHEEFKAAFDVVATEELQKRILIQSAFNTIRDSVKKYYPMMVYGSTSGDSLRFNVFQNIGIETAIPFKGDVFISAMFDKKIKIMDTKIREEMRRRHKKVYIGPIQNESEYLMASELKPDGYIFTEQTFGMFSKNHHQ